MTVVSIEFRRDPKCEHDERRECTPCFRASIRQTIGDDEEEETWKGIAELHRTTVEDAIEAADGLSYFLDHGLQPEVPLCMIQEDPP